MQKPIYVVVVNWNLKDDTIACVESLRAAGASLRQIVVVDNASTDGSVPALRERFGPALPLLQNAANLGFAAANNRGISHALMQGAGWVLLVNNDTVVAPTFFDELQKAIAEHPRFAILAPLILYFDAPDRIWHLGDRLIPGTLATVSLYRNRRDRGQLPPLLPVDFVTGCGMLVRRDVFQTIGLFDTGFFMYAEEVDFCWRARRAGFQIACAPKAKMWHKVSRSANRDRPIARYRRVRNQIRFYRRYAAGLQRPLMMGFTLLRSAGVALGDLLHRQPSLVSPLLRAWRDGWFGDPNATEEL